MKRISFIIPNKPLSATPEFVNEVTFGKHLRMELVARKTNHVISRLAL